MKVFVSARDAGMHAAMEPQFGHAPWFVLVDTETGECSSHENSAARVITHGADARAAGLAADLGADAVVSGCVEDDAAWVLDAVGVQAYLATGGTVADVVEQLQQGSLRLTWE